MAQKKRFQKQYRLVRGYPCIMDTSSISSEMIFLQNKDLKFWDTCELDYPVEFRGITKATPEYELILRRIKRGKKKAKRRQTEKRENW